MCVCVCVCVCVGRSLFIYIYIYIYIGFLQSSKSGVENKSVRTIKLF